MWSVSCRLSHCVAKHMWSQALNHELKAISWMAIIATWGEKLFSPNFYDKELKQTHKERRRRVISYQPCDDSRADMTWNDPRGFPHSSWHKTSNTFRSRSPLAALAAARQYHHTSTLQLTAVIYRKTFSLTTSYSLLLMSTWTRYWEKLSFSLYFQQQSYKDFSVK